MLDAKLKQYFNDKTVLVTGGTGLIGRQVVDLLLQTTALVRTVSLDELTLSSKVEHHCGDLCDFKLCKEICKDVDIVIHTAGIKGSLQVTLDRPASFFVPLLMMNTNLLEACRLNNVADIVYTSSIGAYASSDIFSEGQANDGEPMDQYPGWAKRMAELQIKAYGIEYGLKNFSIVRPCNVYGPGDNFDKDSAMVIPALMNRIASSEDPLMIWGDGSAVRDFCFSSDVAKGILQAACFGTQGQVVNLASGIGYSIKELVETLNKVVDFNYTFDASKNAGFPKRVMNIDLARQLLSYEPLTSLFEGLQETWDWYLDNKEQHLRKQNYFRVDREKSYEGE